MRWTCALVALASLAAPLAAEAAPNPDKLAKRITSAPDLRHAVAATQDALVAAGVGIVSNGKVLKRAKRPAPIAASGMEVLNLGFEAWHKETAGGMSLRDLATELRRARFPFRKPRKAASALRKFLKVWVRTARQHKGDPRSFNARFLAAMAKRQSRPVNLAKGNYDPKFLRLTQLEVELFVAAFQRGPKRLWKGSKRGGHSASVSDDSPCSDYRKFQKEQLKELYGENVANDLDAVLDYGFGMIAGELNKTGDVVEKGVARGIEEGLLAAGRRDPELSAKAAKHFMTALNLLQKMQKLATLYGSVGMLVQPQSEVFHKDHNGNKVPVWFAAAVGLNGEGQQEYEELKQARAQESGLFKSLKDCLKLFGLPSLTDAGDIADELEKWRVHWKFYYLNSHAEANIKDNVWDGGKRYTHKLTKINDTLAGTRKAFVNIRPEGPNDRAGCKEMFGYKSVTADADVDISQGPNLGTVIHVITGDIAGVAIEAAENMFGNLVAPSGSVTMTIEYHVPDKATARAAQVCRAYPPKWTGTANGQFTRDGLTTTWNATYTVVQYAQDTEYAMYNSDPSAGGGGTINWSTSGTETSSGCSVSGSGTTSFAGEFDINQYDFDMNYYGRFANGHVFGGTETGGMDRTCPGDSEPNHVVDSPLKHPICELAGPYSGQSSVSGSRSFNVDYFGETVPANCSWTLNAQS